MILFDFDNNLLLKLLYCASPVLTTGDNSRTDAFEILSCEPTDIDFKTLDGWSIIVGIYDKLNWYYWDGIWAN